MADFANILLRIVALRGVSFKIENCNYRAGFFVHVTKEHTTNTTFISYDTLGKVDDIDGFLESTIEEGAHKLLEELEHRHKLLEKFRAKYKDTLIDINTEALNDTKGDSQ